MRSNVTIALCTTRSKHNSRYSRNVNSGDRLTGGFEYVGPALPADRARAFLEATPRMFIPGAREARALELIRRHRGATFGFLHKRMRLSTTGVRATLTRLIAAGEIHQVATGGPADPFSFYPARRDAYG